MNQDRELLELAAKAAGIYVKAWNHIGYAITLDERGRPVGWNPLNDDGDALRLLARLRKLYGAILLAIFEGRVECGDESARHSMVLITNGGIESAVRRAITTTAAEIGKAMP